MAADESRKRKREKMTREELVEHVHTQVIAPAIDGLSHVRYGAFSDTAEYFIRYRVEITLVYSDEDRGFLLTAGDLRHLIVLVQAKFESGQDVLVTIDRTKPELVLWVPHSAVSVPVPEHSIDFLGALLAGLRSKGEHVKKQRISPPSPSSSSPEPEYVDTIRSLATTLEDMEETVESMQCSLDKIASVQRVHSVRLDEIMETLDQLRRE